MSTLKKIISFILSIVIAFVFCSCSSSTTPIYDDNSFSDSIIIEDIEIDNLVVLEEYAEELELVEEEITNLLLEDSSIEDVILCQTIYVPQDRIYEFSNESYMANLFADNFDMGAVLAKVAIGTGIILTLTVLSCVGLAGPVASIVAAAAPSAAIGAAIGTGAGGLIGGLTGATNAVDQTGRTSAIIGFSIAVVGVIIAAVSLALAIPSGGSSAITTAIGIKIAMAGISLAGFTVGAGVSGYNMVKTFNQTDATDIDWDNIDWNKVGASAALHAIEGAADGYMWGSIIGAVNGGVKGLEYYETHGSPYSTYKARIDRTPVDGERGHWTGQRGESTYVLSEPITTKSGAVVREITYKNGIPDFKGYQIAKVNISNMTNKRYNNGGNFEQANKELAKLWTKQKYEGKSTWTAKDISNYIEENNLTWHEMNNMHSMQLVPNEVNASFGHLGGVGEYNAKIGGLNKTYG